MSATESPDGSYVPLHLDWPGCLNARDLGGMPTTDGRRIRDRSLIRTDGHHKLTPEGVAAVRDYGVSRIVDLRRQRELDIEPSPFFGDPVYLHLPVQNPADPDHEWMTLADIYIAMLDLRPALFTSAVIAIADAPPGGVVVHCAGGKDRTGITVALALVVAGVAPELISADYALTEQRLAEEAAAHLETLTDSREREIVRGLQPTPPTNITRVLDHLTERYGSVEGFLEAGGMTATQRSALRVRLVGE
ncbi:tyrosine-protein phosphatase [Microlunatus speluncae]|uniref:tyrosine-protein phosphatase n=1 Tax=Microlunatus speluncae TaxID=2594267 RepID=UPI001266326D|nr:tyrosine-protein phosphatase [Microlunatus speluncae]